MCCFIEILTWPNKGEKIDRYHCKFTSLHLASDKVQFSIIKSLNVIYQQHLIYYIANVSTHKCFSPFTRLSRHLVLPSCLRSFTFILVHFPGKGHFHFSNVRVLSVPLIRRWGRLHSVIKTLGRGKQSLMFN